MAGRGVTFGFFVNSGANSALIFVYSGSVSILETIACTGHSATHNPQSMQVSGSMTMNGSPL